MILDEFKQEPGSVFVMEHGLENRPVPLTELFEPEWLARFSLGRLYEHGEFGGQQQRPECPGRRVAERMTGGAKLAVVALRIYTQVRERCSFHLFRPMTEAYFFGDATALQRAGVSRPHQLPAEPRPRTLPYDRSRVPGSAFRNEPDRGHARPRIPSQMLLRYLCDPTLTDKRKRYRETAKA